MPLTIEAVFKGTPYSMPPNWDGTVTIYKEWPAWQKKMWYDVLGAPPEAAWVPTFEPGPFIVRSENGVIATIDPHIFATEETAIWILHRFGAERIVSVPFDGAGGPNAGPVRVRWVEWGDGLGIIAGKLAERFLQTPEEFGSRVANDACMHDIADGRQNRARVPVPA